MHAYITYLCALLFIHAYLISCPVLQMTFTDSSSHTHIELYGDNHAPKMDRSHPHLVIKTRDYFLKAAHETSAMFFFECRTHTDWPHLDTFINNIGREIAINFPEQFTNIDLLRRIIMACILKNDPAGMQLLTSIAEQTDNSPITKKLTALACRSNQAEYFCECILYPMYDSIAHDLRAILSTLRNYPLPVFNPEDQFNIGSFRKSPYEQLWNILCSIMELDTVLQLIDHLENRHDMHPHIILYTGAWHTLALGGILILLGFEVSAHEELIPGAISSIRNAAHKQLFYPLDRHHPGIPCTKEIVKRWRAYWDAVYRRTISA